MPPPSGRDLQPQPWHIAMPSGGGVQPIGLVPAISLSQTRRTLGERVDGRDKPGHDVLGFLAMHTNFSIRTLATCPIFRAHLRRHVITPLNLETEYYITGGNIFHVSMVGTENLFANRSCRGEWCEKIYYDSWYIEADVGLQVTPVRELYYSGLGLLSRTGGAGWNDIAFDRVSLKSCIRGCGCRGWMWTLE